MTATIDARGPTYISSHSADVILSEVRPIKLHADALRSINVLLDEVLYSILAAARSLSTEKLRAGLLKVLPTSLGKDALLEAEVELRAYRDRTLMPSGPDSAKNTDDSRYFHLQWAFELLRLKCEAYSTLNDADEDPEAEVRLQNRMGQAGGLSPPKASLVAPASLYLTAILESLCEHILSNVARVTARDSSKESATIQDVFVALCEDNSIYTLFRQMKVYEHIEGLSKASKPRRSKSLTMGGHRVSDQDLVSSKGSGSAHHTSRMSSDSMGSGSSPSAHVGGSARGSSDKTRSMKMFGKISTDREALNGDLSRSHKKSDSFRRDDTRQTASPNSMAKPSEDAALLQEFDNLMLSDATMKMSLTPDRLKTMDLFSKERSQRPGLKGEFDQSPPPLPRGAGKPSMLRPVDLIVEDDEDNSPIKPPMSKKSSAPVTPVTASPKLFRNRSSSASHPPSAARGIVKKPSHPDVNVNVNGPTPSQPSTRERRTSQTSETFSMRNRKLMPVSSTDIDLDDMAKTSDDDDARFGKKTSQPRTPLAVSAKTQDLINFLSEGPPPDLMVNSSAVSLESSKSRGSGRLQRMISKLSMGNSSDKLQTRVNGDSSKKNGRQPSASFSTSSGPSKGFTAGTSLANRPIPPRPPPPPISPPSSSSQDSLVDLGAPDLDERNIHTARQTVPTPEAKPITLTATSPANGIVKSNGIPQPNSTAIPNGQPKQDINGTNKDQSRKPSPEPEPKLQDGTLKTKCETCASRKAAARTTMSRPTTATKLAPTLSIPLARDIQRQMSAATTVDECRLLFDMFLAKSGIPMEPTNDDQPYPSPAPSLIPSSSTSSDIDMEHLLVELLLGSDSGTDVSSIVESDEGKAGPADPSVVLDDPPKVSTSVSTH